MNAETKVKAAAGISAALVKALTEIEGVTKDKVNPHFKSKYADLASVLDSVRPVFAKYDMAVTQETSPSEDGVIVETVVLHASGEERRFGKLYVPANKRDAQGAGSALTYARRYSLMTAFGVPAEDDDGNAAVKATANPSTGEQPPAKSAARDAVPFALGPAKNKTQLKDMGRAFWKDVEACGDEDELIALIASSKPLIDQIKAELPTWWDGGQSNSGEPFEGLSHVIDRNLYDFRNLNQRTPLDAG